MPEQFHSDQAKGQLRRIFMQMGLIEHSAPKQVKRQLSPEYKEREAYDLAFFLASYLHFFINNGFDNNELVKHFNTKAGLVMLGEMLQDEFPVTDHEYDPENWETYLFPHKKVDVVLRGLVDAFAKDLELRHWATQDDHKLESDTELRAGMLLINFERFLKFRKKIIQETFLDSEQLLVEFLGPQNPDRHLLFARFTPAAFFEEVKRHFNSTHARKLKYLLITSGPEVATKYMIATFLRQNEAESSWGYRMKSLDLLLEMLPWGMMSLIEQEQALIALFTEYYLNAAENEDTASAQPEPAVVRQWVSDVLNQKGRRYIARSARVTPDISGASLIQEMRPAPDTFFSSRPEQRALHKLIDSLESAHHPTAHLKGYRGIEIEANVVDELPSAHYLYLERKVVHRDKEGDFEMAAGACRDINTLLILYQRLFESGLLDLFAQTQYSLHFNFNVKFKELLIESLSFLSLTGYMGVGRQGTSISSAILSKLKSLGAYLEWKQGDVLTPETLLMGLQLWDGVMKAQLAYEVVLDRMRITNSEPMVAMAQTDSGIMASQLLSEEEILNPKLVAISPEQRQMALLYRSYILKMRHGLAKLSRTFPGNINLEAVVNGEGQGHLQISQLLGTVFPDLESYLEVSPAEQFSQLEKYVKEQQALSGGKMTKEYIAAQNIWFECAGPLAMVALAQEAATETMHAVNKVIETAEDKYTEAMLDLVTGQKNRSKDETLDIFTDILIRFPCGQRVQNFLSASNQQKQWLTAKLVRERLQWLLNTSSPVLNQETKNIFAAALHTFS